MADLPKDLAITLACHVHQFDFFGWLDRYLASLYPDTERTHVLTPPSEST